ncbi:MAG TPA: VOC family protein [Bacillales bacterium]|nr:VOC family protein [Bacillales bacterium]
MNFLQLNKVYLPVKDLEDTAKWYRDQFGLTKSWEGEVDGRQAAELAFSETSFTLIGSDHVNRYSHIPFNFHTNEIEAVRDSLMRKGSVVTDVIDEGEMYCCDFYDPEGNRIGLVEEKNGATDQMQVGGTFLTVRDLEDAIKWYRNKLDYDFHFFSVTGGAGYIGQTPEYVQELTIRYAPVSSESFQTRSSRMAIVETPEFFPLTYKAYSILSSNIEEDYETLRSRGVHIVQKSDQKFTFQDADGNEIEIVKEKR